MALIPIQSGGALAPVAASELGDTYENDGSAFLFILGADGKTITVSSPNAGRVDFTRAITSSLHLLDRFDPLWWNDENGLVSFAFDDHVGVQVVAIRSGVIASDPAASPLPGLI